MPQSAGPVPVKLEIRAGEIAVCGFDWFGSTWRWRTNWSVLRIWPPANTVRFHSPICAAGAGIGGPDEHRRAPRPGPQRISRTVRLTTPQRAARALRSSRSSNDIGEELMTLEEAKQLIQQTRSFIGRIYSHEVVLDGPFNPQELEAILFVMRNRPAPPYETSA